jgi:amidophosphoribosyltransferase
MKKPLSFPPHPYLPSKEESRWIDDLSPKEECGLFGIFDHPDAAAHTALGMHALQHRGQEAGGIVAYDGEQFHSHRAIGLVGDHFNSIKTMERLVGNAAIGHVRYSTTGDSVIRNVQPLLSEFKFGGFAVAHNGNLTNALKLRRELIDRGCLFQSTSDSETIVHLIARSECGKVVDRLIDALSHIEGAYSLVALSQKKLIGLRDPYGVRPLVIGRIGKSYILTSETCALDIIGADFVRDVEPGEVVVIDESGLHSLKPFPAKPSRFCVFEYIYFARPDSDVEGKNVYTIRKQIGAELARESADIEADVVVPVPDSGVPAAIGYAEEAGIPFELGIIRNHYVGRTFIEPTDQIRHLGVRLKHNANAGQLKDKRVVLVDDSIVRGTTSVKIVEMVRNAGAKEVHMRISSPPINGSCFYGIDTPERSTLLAARMDLEEMKKYIGVDSLAYISDDGLYRAVGEVNRDKECPQYCDACFTGDYPIHRTDFEGDDDPGQLSLLDDPH